MNAPDSTRVINAERRAADRHLLGRILGPALVASVVLHSAALLLFQFEPPARDELPPPPPRVVRVVEAMQAFDIRLVRVEAPSIEVQIQRPQDEPAAVPTLPMPTVTGVAPITTAPIRDPDDPALARLKYRNDPRQNVWRRSEPAAPTPDEVVRERVASQIAAYNDSVAAEAAARARATDWTVKDGEGGRWGVSPGAIHLGTVTLPLPFAFSPPPGRREEIAGRVNTWNEIQQQATFVEGRDVIKDRVKAMEKRKAAERAARQGTKGGSSGGGTPGGGGGRPDGGN